MHPTCRHSCQSPKATDHCYHTFGVVACWLYQHWDNDGVGSIPKGGEPFGLLWPFYEACYGICDSQSNCKNFAQFLWQGYISIFRAPAKLLSDWGANFESNIIRELCELIGLQKVRTLPYHAQANGQVEWAHQMLMHIIGQLSKDQKLDWPKHLPELVHAYNSTSVAITRYSLHYLMVRCQLHLPIIFYFPIHRNINALTTTSLLTCVKDCGRPLKRLKCSPHQRWRDRSATMTGKLTLFHWSQVTWSWVMPTPTEGGERWRITGRRNHMKWSTKLWRASLPTLWKTSGLDANESSNEINLFWWLWQKGLISVWLCRPSRPGAPPQP